MKTRCSLIVYPDLTLGFSFLSRSLIHPHYVPMTTPVPEYIILQREVEEKQTNKPTNPCKYRTTHNGNNGSCLKSFIMVRREQSEEVCALISLNKANRSTFVRVWELWGVLFPAVTLTVQRINRMKSWWRGDGEEMESSRLSERCCCSRKNKRFPLYLTSPTTHSHILLSLVLTLPISPHPGWFPPVYSAVQFFSSSLVSVSVKAAAVCELCRETKRERFMKLVRASEFDFILYFVGFFSVCITVVDMLLSLFFFSGFFFLALLVFVSFLVLVLSLSSSVFHLLPQLPLTCSLLLLCCLSIISRSSGRTLVLPTGSSVPCPGRRPVAAAPAGLIGSGLVAELVSSTRSCWTWHQRGDGHDNSPTGLLELEETCESFTLKWKSRIFDYRPKQSCY